MRSALVLIAGVTLLVIVGCGNSGQVEACVVRGVAYFKEIGSHPIEWRPPATVLSAEDVARERCRRTTTAF